MRHRGIIIMCSLASMALIPLFCVSAFAEIITLKSGKVLNARITEETPDYIKIDYNSMPVYYERKAIKGIEKNEKPGTEIKAANKEVATDNALDNNSTLCLKKGLEYAFQGKFGESESELRQGFKLDSSDNNISGALGIIDDLKNGKVSRELALNLFKGSYYLMNEDYKRAAIYLGKCHRMKTDDPDICYNLGIAYSRMNNYSASIHYLKKAVEARPEDAEACMVLGCAYYSAGKHKEAKEYLRLAKQLMQKNSARRDIDKIDLLLKELS